MDLLVLLIFIEMRNGDCMWNEGRYKMLESKGQLSDRVELDTGKEVGVEHKAYLLIQMGMKITGCKPPGVEYGCYCAIGSPPEYEVDPIDDYDAACKQHDRCIEDVSGSYSCKMGDPYEWEARNGKIACLSEPPGCPGMCACDSALVNSAKEILGDGDCPTETEPCPQKRDAFDQLELQDRKMVNMRERKSTAVDLGASVSLVAVANLVTAAAAAADSFPG